MSYTHISLKFTTNECFKQYTTLVPLKSCISKHVRVTAMTHSVIYEYLTSTNQFFIGLTDKNTYWLDVLKHTNYGSDAIMQSGKFSVPCDDSYSHFIVVNIEKTAFYFGYRQKFILINQFMLVKHFLVESRNFLLQNRITFTGN